MQLNNLKVLMHSNAVWAGSGYGVQTDVVTRWLKQNGHTPVVSAFYGLRGAPINYDGVPVLPGSNEQWGNDVLVAHYDALRPDVLLLLMDAWILEDRPLELTPAALWCPIDHTPIPPAVAEQLHKIKWLIAMSRHGEREMRRAGFDPFYVPHMVDTQQFAPMEQDHARKLWNVGERFFVASVAANKGYPPRKNLDRLLKAWSVFVQDVPDALLYLHTMPYPASGGPDLRAICDLYGLEYHIASRAAEIPPKRATVAFPDVYRMTMGEYSPTVLNTLYNAADAFILPSAGEGFGIPIIEAQAAGCPAIVTDWTAMSELGTTGYRIPIDPVDDVLVTQQYSEQAQPKVSSIVKALQWAYKRRGDVELRARARAFALDYDVDTVMRKHMLPVLQSIALGNADWLAYQGYRQAS